MDLFDLTGKTALVTGSSRGLGKVFAHGLGRAGAAVVLNSRHPDTLAEAQAELAQEGIQASTSCFDVTQEEQVEAAVEEVEAQVAPINVLVNNAGVNLRGPLEELPTERWKKLMAVNLDGVFYVSRAVGRRMVARQNGKIVNICSLMSEGGRPTTAPYAASKGAVKMLTRAMAVEWGPKNIQVNGVGPGYFLTEMTRHMAEDPEWDRWVRESTPARRWGDPEELVGAVVFLASGASSFVNGQIIYVDGGWLAAL
ncbi:MAG: glucose 1-dehydrogenase [Candidatus Brocadiaceae bacterium]|jgi:gluconate 5-dehydrogenase